MRRARRITLAAIVALLCPVFLIGTAQAATPQWISIGARGVVLPGGTGAVLSLTYRCSTFSYLAVNVTQAATNDRVASASGSITPACDGVQHAAKIVAPTQAGVPLRIGAAAILVQTSAPRTVRRVVTLHPSTLTTPGVVTSARRLGHGAVLNIKVPIVGCPTGGTVTGLVTVAQRVGQQIQLGESANYPREGPPSVPCDQATPNLPLAVIAPLQPWSLQPALVTAQVQLCTPEFSCTGWTRSTVVELTNTTAASQP